jgi:xylulokinase
VLLGIDLGTSSVKVAVVALDGSARQVASAGYAMDSPYTRWAETDPAAWWMATRTAVTSLNPAHLRDIHAVGLSGQMHGVVLVDKVGRPLRPAVLWADGRSTDEVARYRQLDEGVLHRLANAPSTGMAGPTLLWLKGHESSLYESARWALQPKDWLRMKLTREAYGEPTDASGTLLYDFIADAWAQDLLDELDVRAELLPALVPSYLPAGRITKKAAGELGIRPGVIVAAGAADTAASLVGHEVLAPGPMVMTIGTGAQMTTMQNEFRPDSTMRTNVFRAVENGRWYSMAAILNAGLALDWVRTLFGVGWGALYGSIAQVPPGAAGVSFLPYVVKERVPRLRADAGASWSGIGLQHGRAHLFKSALEGVAFALREAMEALEATGLSATELQLAGGGTASQPWRQMLADVLGKRLLVVDSPESAARGAALLGGLAAGIFKSLDETAALTIRTDLAAEPGPDADEYRRLYERWKEKNPLAGGPEG